MKNKEYIGQKINKWQIIDFEQDEHGGKWLCRCECGKEKWQKVCNVKNGKSKMCKECSGKARKKELKERKERIIKIRYDSNREWSKENTFIGTYKEYLEACKKRREEKRIANRRIPISYDRLYKTHQGMKARCYNSNSDSYKYYGGRGITICDEWRNSYKAFKEWAINNGYRDDLTIDRIDVNGNYEPSNCRWITNKEQQRNKRTNHLIECNGDIKPLCEWAEIYGINAETIVCRIKAELPKELWFVKRIKRTSKKRKKYEDTVLYQKDLKKARKTLATVLKRVQIKKLLSNIDN
jgi:hypothetical protein